MPWRSLTFGVVSGSRLVGVVRWEPAAAACVICGQARFEHQLADAKSAAAWIVDHLAQVHVYQELHVKQESRPSISWRICVAQIEPVFRSLPASGARDLSPTPGGGDGPHRERRRSA
jgi:hypothetical protein